MNEKWILFSYSIPAANAKARMRTWRRVSATGAVQLKTGLQILPCREELLETVTWLIGEVRTAGGEAIALQCDRIEGMTEVQIEQLFQSQIDGEFLQLQSEAKALLASLELADGDAAPKEARAALDKLRRRCEAVRERDFFPSGAAAQTLVLLDAIVDRMQSPVRLELTSRLVERTSYHSRIWVTRSRPYIDRLASAWLIRRFIDPEATFRFLAAGQAPAIDQGEVPFDMAMGEFTHRGELVTFEVIAEDFSLHDKALEKIGALVRAIDIRQEELGEEAGFLKTQLDGLVSLTSDDHLLMEKAGVIFDAIHAGLAKAHNHKR